MIKVPITMSLSFLDRATTEDDLVDFYQIEDPKLRERLMRAVNMAREEDETDTEVSARLVLGGISTRTHHYHHSNMTASVIHKTALSETLDSVFKVKYSISHIRASSIMV